MAAAAAGLAMEMVPVGPKAKKRKRMAVDIHKEAPDLEPPTTAERSVDRISNLCNTILGEIITLLPTKEGARTQVLSSRWRHVWRVAPLNLDYRKEPMVDAILSAHQGSGRRICLPAPHYKRQSDDTDVWLRSPALDNLQELEFYLASPHRPHPLLTPPAVTFRFSPTLRVATFSQCYLPYHTVEALRFDQLKKLALLAVKISDRSLYNIVTVGCPVLESLLLSDCSHVGCFRVNSRTLIGMGIRSSPSKLVIQDAPSLQRLVHFEMPMAMQVTVVSAPKLETLGYISERSSGSKIIFGSTVIQVINFILILDFFTRFLISYILKHKEVISYVHFYYVYPNIIFHMLDKGITG
jgi:hypothetical protein